MRHLITLLLLCTLCSTAGAQFDTIAGPFEGDNSLLGYRGEILYTANFGVQSQLLAVDPRLPSRPVRQLFSQFSGFSLGGFCLAGDEVYLSSFGQTVSTGFIYRITDVAAPIPTAEEYLELPYGPTAVAVFDSTLYVGRFGFFGGGILAYDMRRPGEEPELVVDTDGRSVADMEVVDGHLLYLIGQPGRLFSVDLREDVLRPLDLLFLENNPTGFGADGDRLYVSMSNLNINLTSRVRVYDFSDRDRPEFLEEVAGTTRQVITDVARVDGRIYLTEGIAENGEGNYLLRLDGTTSTEPSLADRVPLTVYPNPTRGSLRLPDIQDGRVRCFSTDGRAVLTARITDGRLDLSRLPTGIYQLVVDLEDGTRTAARVVRQ